MGPTAGLEAFMKTKIAPAGNRIMVVQPVIKSLYWLVSPAQL